MPKRSYGRWPRYVPVAERRAKAARGMLARRKKGIQDQPIVIEGRKIARTFWGEAWCNHLEKFSDFENRLPRGRTYVRNGSVCHLAISKGKVEALVIGSDVYQVSIKIKPISARVWQRVRKRCAGQIGSVLELLQGRFSDNVMEIVTDKDDGLFPSPQEIELDCECPDWAQMCKHVAAVLYGVGARLDHQPELLFVLRDVDQQDLIAAELDIESAAQRGKRRRLANRDLSGVFGVEIEEAADEAPDKSAFFPSPEAIAELRKRLNLSASRFAALVGVSVATIYNWEKASGTLNLHQGSIDALTRIAAYSPEEAARNLSIASSASGSVNKGA